MFEKLNAGMNPEGQSVNPVLMSLVIAAGAGLMALFAVTASDRNKAEK